MGCLCNKRKPKINQDNYNINQINLGDNIIYEYKEKKEDNALLFKQKYKSNLSRYKM